MIRRPPRSTQSRSSAASDVYKRQDLMYIKGIAFFVGVLAPLGLVMCVHLVSRTESSIYKAIKRILATVESRGFSNTSFFIDGEGAMAPILPLLQSAGIVVTMAGPGEHVPVAERMIQTIKRRVRCYEHSLPYVMCRVLLSLFCVSRINMQPSTTSVDRISPLDKFSGQKLDAKVHLRCGFGEYVQATVPHTDNTH